MSERPATEHFELPFPQYRCSTCGKEMPLTEARLTVTCADHGTERLQFDVRQAVPADRSEIELICDRAIGETELDVFGSTYDVLRSVNLIAETEEGGLAGLLSLAVVGGDLAIVLLSVYPEYQGAGVGTALLEAADRYAAERALPGIRAAVTNDDLPQLYFYQRLGFTLTDIAVGEAADRLGAAVPGFSGIAVRDEMHLRRAVCRS